MLKTLSKLFLICLLVAILANLWVYLVARDKIKTVETVEQAEVAIVLGAYVRPNGELSYILKDRLDWGYELYRQGKIDKILVTGDHGQVEYNEVQAMKSYLLSRGVPEEDIFMDHAGFDTYDSMYRARDVFMVKSAIVVTQNFHLKRAVYVGSRLGMDVQGVESSLQYPWWYMNSLRDYIAKIKAVWDTDIWHAKPKFLGPQIPISGDGGVTQD